MTHSSSVCSNSIYTCMYVRICKTEQNRVTIFMLLHDPAWVSRNHQLMIDCSSRGTA